MGFLGLTHWSCVNIKRTEVWIQGVVAASVILTVDAVARVLPVRLLCHAESGVRLVLGASSIVGGLLGPAVRLEDTNPGSCTLDFAKDELLSMQAH